MNKSCTACQKSKPSIGPRAVVEINNPPSVVLFHKVPFPASMGDETTNPPDTLDLKNVILEYEATGVVYLYSSDGVPTRLTPDLRAGIQFDNLVGRPQYAGLPMSSKTTIPVVPTYLDGLKDGNRVTELETLTSEQASSQETLSNKVSNLTTEMQDASNQITQNTTDIATNTSGLAEEKTVREQADTNLQNSIAAETAARESAIANLQAQINVGGDIPSEITALQTAVDDINIDLASVRTNVSSNTTEISDLNGNIATLTTTVNSYNNSITEANDTAAQAQTIAESKQDALISGTNIKTVNGESLLGEGDIQIAMGTGGWTVVGPTDNGWTKATNGNSTRYLRSIMTEYTIASTDASSAGSTELLSSGYLLPDELTTGKTFEQLSPTVRVKGEVSLYNETRDTLLATSVNFVLVGTSTPTAAASGGRVRPFVYCNSAVSPGTGYLVGHVELEVTNYTS